MLANTLTAMAAVFFVADLVYTLDHYLVHHDRKRFAATHAVHHARYNRIKDAPQLDAYELTTYSTSGFLLTLAMSVISLFTGNVGFVLGGAAKWAHSLLFHLYQHRFWNIGVPVGRQGIPCPRSNWGLCTDRYHAFHHSNPDDRRFTYAESWAGFDRLLERLDPWLVRHTVDGRPPARRARVADAQEPR